jgi:DNA polymerase-3 subunit alpha
LSIIYLHNHTDGGSNTRLIDCTVKVDRLIDRAVELGSLGVAITDHESVSMHIKAIQRFKELKEQNKIDDNWKLILGNEIYLVDDKYCLKDNYISGETKFHHFILLARDKEGHRQIRELSSKAWDNLYKTGQMERVPIAKSDLKRIIKGNHVIGSTACFIENTDIITDIGIIPIQNIQKGNKVLTHNNCYQKVIVPTSRVYNGDLYTIKTKGATFHITSTDNHQYFIIKKEDFKNYTLYKNLNYYNKNKSLFKRNNRQRFKRNLKQYNPQWVEAKFLKKGDFFLTPIDMTVNNIKTLSLNNDYKEANIYSHNRKELKKSNIVIDKNLLILLGLYTAEGNFMYNDSGITFTMHKKETNIHKFIINTIKDIFGIEGKVRNKKNSNGVSIDFVSIELARVFRHWFTQGAENKHCPEFIKYLDPGMQMHYIKGLFLGDGYFQNSVNKLDSKKTKRRIVYATISKQLIYDVIHILHRNYINPTCFVSQEKNINGVNHKEAYYIEITSKLALYIADYIWGDKLNFNIDLTLLNEKDIPLEYNNNLYMKNKIINIEINKNQTTQVYCMKVENDHSFTANNILVHNCLGGEFPQLVLNLIEAEKQNKIKQVENIKWQIHNFIEWCINIFSKDYFFIEIQPSNMIEQIEFNKKAIQIAKAYGLKWIVTTDTHYIKREDRKIHAAYLNSKDEEREVDDFYSSTYLQSIEEIRKYLSYLDEEDIDLAINNTLLIGEMVENYDFKSDVLVPKIPLPEFEVKHIFKQVYDKYPYIKNFAYSDEEQDRYLFKLIEDGFKSKIWTETLSKEYFYQILDRINTELKELWEITNVINTKLSSYYVTTRQIINIMWEEGDSLVGVARGSVTGFFICYLIDITQINPLQWNLPHWRHLTSSRPEMPDIDIDTAANRRKQILKALQNYFGEDRVLNICTFGTEGSRSAILTACRGLNIDNDTAQYIADMIPFERGSNWSIKDCIEGNEEKERKPIKEFINEINSYENLLEVALGIEGLINKRSIHASGVFIYNDNFVNFNARMKAPNGQYISQWNMNDSEYCGNLKVDLLTIEALDKIRATIDMLVEDGYMEWQGSLRETYNKYIHPDVLDYETPEMWQMIGDNTIVDLFQFDTEVGLQAAQKVKPTNMFEMAVVNSLMRLMGDGKKQPVDQYVEYKTDINKWYQEMKYYNLTPEEIKVLEKRLKKIYGVADTQEVVMQLSMDEKIARFDLKQANKLRKGIAKKKGKIIEEAKELFFEQGKKIGTSENLLNYVWNVQIKRQLGYSFSICHTTPYSCIGLQEMNLAYHYPKLYWETACLTVNAGADADLEENKSSDYGKIASSIGYMQYRGVKIALPDINKADFGFKADIKNSQIIFGLKGIIGIGDDVVNQIIDNRPYNSLQDFLNRMVLCENSSVKNSQMIQLIKAGCFDNLENKPRFEIMKDFLTQIYDPKKELGVRNINNVIEANIVPDEMQIYFRYYNFKNYIIQNEFIHGIVPSKKPTKKGYSDRLIRLDEIAYPFYQEHFSDDNIIDCIDNSIIISEKKFKKEYDKKMEGFKKWISQEEVLKQYNNYLYNELWSKHAEGSISKWEMDSLCFYYSGHELTHVNKEKYNIVNFFELPIEPKVADTYMRKGIERPKYEIVRIVGTVLDKNKHKHTIALLTLDGVVNIKYYDGAFYHYDRQISAKNEEGKKTILEKSWFSRGNLLLLCGFRRGNQFKPYRYKDTIYSHTTTLIEGITLDGDLILRTERIQTNE